jgi:hypothetical protein
MLTETLEVGDRIVAWHQPANDGLVLLCELAHFDFDRSEILRRKWTLVGKVVVEAILDHRADGHLCVGKELLDSVCKQMCGRVAQHFEPLGVLVGDDGNVGISMDGV